MNIRLPIFVTTGALLLATSVTLAAGTPLPGDRGRPADGIPMPRKPGGPPPPPHEAAPKVDSVPIALAVRAAQAIDAACSQYPLGVAVTDAQGIPRVIYVPDRSEAWHGYSAVRKAYTAVVFKDDTSAIAHKLPDDATIMAQMKADLNLQAFPGGVIVKVGDKILGAIGVSGAEPGGHDEECARAGLESIKNELK